MTDFDPLVRARTFDEVADLYDRMRPGQPARVIDAVADRLPSFDGERLLEIGCGTGQATAPLAARGVPIHAIDRGASLIDVARRRLAGADVTFEVADFLHWDPAITYPALLAAQCWHWIPAVEGLDRAARLLRPGAPLLLVWTLDRSEGTAFWRDTQPIYEEFLPSAKDQPPRTLPRITEERIAGLAEHPDFDGVDVLRHSWPRTWADGTYLDLLRTQSPVRALEEDVRRRFLSAMAEVVDAHHGTVTRELESLLVAARRA